MELQSTSLIFDLKIPSKHLGSFRGAIAEMMGIQHDLFHNHFQNEQGQARVHYRYPLIQYQMVSGRPSLLFIGKARQELAALLSEDKDWNISLEGKPLALSLFSKKEYQYSLGTHPQGGYYTYALHNWLALNQSNYEAFKQCRGLVAQCQFLERILANHLIGFAKGVGWQIPKDKGRFEASIQSIQGHALRRYKEVKFEVFDVVFETQLSLPSHIGLGKAVSLGFGKLQPLYQKQAVEDVAFPMLEMTF